MLTEMVYRFEVKLKIAYVEKISHNDRYDYKEPKEANVNFYALKEISEKEAYFEAMQFWYSCRMAYADSITGCEITQISLVECSCKSVELEADNYLEFINKLNANTVVDYK